MAIAFKASIPGTPLGVRTIRHELTRLAEDCGMDAEEVSDVRLAVTEAATNAVLHAYAETEGDVDVTAEVRDGELAVVIADSGPGLVERPDSPGLGVGLAVMANVALRMRIVSDGRGTAVHMAFRCPGAREARRGARAPRIRPAACACIWRAKRRCSRVTSRSTRARSSMRAARSTEGAGVGAAVCTDIARAPRAKNRYAGARHRPRMER